MNNRHRYKVLELPFYLEPQNLAYYQKDTHELEVEPRFGRDGVYFDRFAHIRCWVEYCGGTKAMEYDPKQFLFELQMENHTPLSVKVRAAILTLIREGTCPRSLQELYEVDHVWHDIRNAGRDGALAGLQMRKRWQEYIAGR